MLKKMLKEITFGLGAVPLSLFGLAATPGVRLPVENPGNRNADVLLMVAAGAKPQHADATIRVRKKTEGCRLKLM